MHDLEQDIRRILDEDAHDAPLISSAPANIARQVRRRQVRFATVASLCTVAIGIGLFVGFRAFMPSDGAVPGETETIHPDVIASGTLEGVGEWWLAAREVDGRAQLVFHRPGETDTIWPDAPEQVFAIAGRSFLEPSPDITLPSYWMVLGIVIPDAARVEVRLADGRTIVADLAPMPAGALGSYKAFIALDLADDPSSLIPPTGPSWRSTRAERSSIAKTSGSHGPRTWRTRRRCDLRNALVAALTYYTDGATFVGFTPTVAASLEPGLTFNIASEAVTDEISIRDAAEGRPRPRDAGEGRHRVVHRAAGRRQSDDVRRGGRADRRRVRRRRRRVGGLTVVGDAFAVQLPVSDRVVDARDRDGHGSG